MLVSITAVYAWDQTIFDRFAIPATMDKPLLIKLILQKLAELSLLYSDPEYLKEMIGIWSQTRIIIWDRLWTLALKEYNPIDNYNKTETRGKGRSGGMNGTDSIQNYNYGYNEEQRRAHHDDREEQYQQNYNDYEDEDIHGQGNIGVTTTQQMIQQELDVRPKLDMYNYIVEEFKNEFCIMVY